ncbi:glycosyltransferase family 8 protein [Amniculicola lignicola CBS 123094]|uniref:Glycosyltransferase family 8 protein n=1 Tax=Amniculicola lignicola CBS 123094 TaxID=1392246 RepID=A0A6A5VYJ8_9PLEO|nr:glycosyltransferase family 8 protein [Amniculicola lignicola CBS 123094]
MKAICGSRAFLYTAVAAVTVLLLFMGISYAPSPQTLRSSIKSMTKPEPPKDRPTVPTYISASNTRNGEKLAYVSWLSSTVAGKDNEDLDKDLYFIGTRILVWQLLHYYKTKTKNIDVVIITTPDVSQSRIDRLRKDGAIVKPIEFVHGHNDSWLQPEQARWNGIMSKLRAWQMTEYSRILMLDGDMILQSNLDGIFDDPGAQILKTKQNIEHPSDENDLPDEYLLASMGEVESPKHDYPPDWDHGLKKPGKFCAGFFMLKPSDKIFDYYTGLLDIPGRFNPDFMEQNLLNYAHRWEGPMPWREIAYTWNIRSVNENDFNMGVVSIHEKWWENPWSGSKRVKDFFMSIRWQMEGFYQARDMLSAQGHEP